MIKMRDLLKENNQWLKNKHSYLEKDVVLVDIDKLKTNPNEKWSSEYENIGTGKEYTDKIALALKSGKKLPAIEVKEYPNGDWIIIDGQHRFKGAIKAGLKQIGVQFTK